MAKAKTPVRQPQDLGQATDGIRRLNLGDENEPARDGANIKEAISSVYDSVASSWSLGDTWNWGLLDPEIARKLDELIQGYDRFGTDGFSEQMYFYTLRQIPTAITDYRGMRILEIGSGLGGGLNFLSRILEGAEFTGVDLSPVAVQRANSRYHRLGSVSFTCGDAECLPFEDGTFDTVLNIESSHNYPDLVAFLAEVARVLKPGGHFSMTDFFTDQQQERLDRAKARCPQLAWIAQSDISQEVSASVRKRMTSGSYIQTELSKQRMPLMRRILTKHAVEASMGGLFTGDASSGPFARWARKRAGVAIMDQAIIRAYTNHVAIRQSSLM